MANKVIGRRYGRLVVKSFDRVEREGTTKYPAYYFKCLCDCGTLCSVRYNCLITGKTKSCGCYRREAARERQILKSVKRKLEKQQNK